MHAPNTRWPRLALPSAANGLASSVSESAIATMKVPFMIVLRAVVTWMRHDRALSRACRTVSFSENRQIGGGCVRGLTKRSNAPSSKNGGGPPAICERTMGAGNIVATKLRHLNAQATEDLPSSDGGQHGMSA